MPFRTKPSEYNWLILISTAWGHFAETLLELFMYVQFAQELVSEASSLYKFLDKMNFLQAGSLLETS